MGQFNRATLRLAATALAVAALISCTSILRADGVQRDAIGAIPTGRGGTNQGFADNGVILFDNPAAMVNVAGRGLFDVGVDTVICDLHYTDQDPNNTRAKTRPFPAPEIAYIRKSEDGRWAYGLGAFAPAGFGASYNMQNSATGPQVYRSLGVLGKVLPGVAYKVNEKLSVGGTLGLAFSDIELHGTYFIQTGALAGVPALMNVQSLGVAPTGSIALQYQWTEQTTLGVTYSEQTNFNMHGPMHVDALGLTSRFEGDVRLNWPRTLATGFKHDICPHHRVAADVIWYNWSNAFRNLGMTLTDSSNPVFPALVGPTIHDTFPLNWRDSVSLKLGYEWEPNTRNIYRAGYVYHASPAPDSTLNPYTDGVLEHAFSLGYSRRQPKYLFNLAYQYSFGPTRTVGQSDIVGGDFSNSTFKAQAHWASIGFVVPF